MWKALLLYALMMSTQPVQAQNAQTQRVPKVLVDGVEVHFNSTGPRQIEGRLLVPMGIIFEALNASVTYHASTGRLTAVQGNRTIRFRVGETSASVNGITYSLDAPIRSIGGRVYVPLRFISELAGANVTFDAKNNTIAIVSGSLGPRMLKPGLPTEIAFPSVAQEIVVNGVIRQISSSVIALTNGAIYRVKSEAEVSLPGGEMARWHELRPLTDVALDLDASRSVVSARIVGKYNGKRSELSLTELMPVEGTSAMRGVTAVVGHVFDRTVLMPNGKAVFSNRNGYDLFEAWIGYSGTGKGSLQFAVYGDGVLLYKSPYMTSNNEAQKISVPIAGYSGFTLQVIRGDGAPERHLNGAWGNPVLSRQTEKKRALTNLPLPVSRPGKAPSINFPKDGSLATPQLIVQNKPALIVDGQATPNTSVLVSVMLNGTGDKRLRFAEKTLTQVVRSDNNGVWKSTPFVLLRPRDGQEMKLEVTAATADMTDIPAAATIATVTYK
jgi:hypothetical protein